MSYFIQTGISYTGRSRKAYVVVGRTVVRVKLPTGKSGG